MQIVGYKLVEDATGKILGQWGGQYGSCPGFPNPLFLPNGDHVHGGSLNVSYDGFTVVPWEMERPLKTVFDGAEFLARVNDDEYVAITASDNVQIRRWLEVFRLRGEIDVGGKTAQEAKAGLVISKLLTQERADIIFAAE